MNQQKYIIERNYKNNCLVVTAPQINVKIGEGVILTIKNVGAGNSEIKKQNNMTKINFTQEKIEELKKSYAEALKSGKESFMFEGQEIIVGYAKYLIEFLNKNA